MFCPLTHGTSGERTPLGGNRGLGGRLAPGRLVCYHRPLWTALCARGARPRKGGITLVRRILLGMAAGLVAGPVVGMADAVYVLTSGPPADYLALVYAVLLYAGAGLALGGVAGLGLVLLANRSWRRIPHIPNVFLSAIMASVWRSATTFDSPWNSEASCRPMTGSNTFAFISFMSFSMMSSLDRL